MSEMPSEDEMREIIRNRLTVPSLGMREPPPIVVDEVMRAYFGEWASRGTKARADLWLEMRIHSMVTA